MTGPGRWERWARGPLGALLVPGLCALWLFRGVLFLGELPFRRDMSAQFIPLKRVFSDALHAGYFPQWWPWDGLGMPLAAMPLLSGFHPSSLFFLALPFHLAFVLQYFLPVPLALGGTWRLGRALGLRPVFAALAATGYVFGAYFLDVTEFTYISLAAGALPWLLWGALRCRSSLRPRPLVFSLALASMLLAGDPVLSVLGLLGAGVWVVRGVSPRRQVRPVVTFVLGTGLALALSAVQSLPALLLLRESPRARGLELGGPNVWRLDLPQLLAMGVPRELGEELPLFEMTYLGLGMAALALVGAGLRGWGRGRLGGLSVLYLGLAFGGATPLWAVFSAVVPTWKSIQFPIKAIGPAMLLLSLLAARGAQGVLRADRRRFLPALACALAALGATVGAGPSTPVVMCLLLALVWGVMAASPRLARPLAPVALAIVALDLGLANGHVLATLPPDFYAPPPLVKPLREGGVSGEGGCYTEIWQEPERLRGFEARSIARSAALFPARGALHGLPACTPYLPGYSARYAELWLGEGIKQPQRLMGIYGSRFIITQPSRLTAEQRARVVAMEESIDAVVLSQRLYLPRAYTVSGVKVLPRAEVMDYVLNRMRPGEEVVLEAEAVGESFDVPPAGRARPVESLRRDGDAVEIEATLTAPGMLVLNEAYYDGFEVYEEGQRLPLYPANHAVRAVPLGAGRHRVRFEYHTPGLVPGALVSLAALGLVVGGGVFQARRRRAR